MSYFNDTITTDEIDNFVVINDIMLSDKCYLVFGISHMAACRFTFCLLLQNQTLTTFLSIINLAAISSNCIAEGREFLPNSASNSSFCSF